MRLLKEPISMFKLCKTNFTITKKNIVRQSDNNVWYFIENGQSIMERKKNSYHQFFTSFEDAQKEAWKLASLELNRAVARVANINKKIIFLSMKEGAE